MSWVRIGSGPVSPRFFKGLLLTGMLLVLLALSGCGGDSSLLPENRSQGDGDKLEAAVYLDSTLSMQGFANFPTEGEYARALNNIEQTGNVGWKEAKISYYRYGDQLRAITRDEFRQALTPGFYRDNDAKLQRLIGSLEPDKVNILVTDLFQTDQDIQAIVTALKDRFMNKDSALVILGLKSRFKGVVYDIGHNSAQFAYSSGTDKDRFKPFFLLMMGPKSRVLSFNRQFNKTLPAEIERRQVIYTAAGGSDTEVLTVSEDQVLQEGERTYAATEELLPTPAAYPQFLLKDNPGALNLTYRLPGSATAELRATALRLGKPQLYAKGTEAVGGFRPVEAAGFITGRVVKTEAADNSLRARLQLQLRPEQLPEKGIYRVPVGLYPSLEDYQRVQAGLDPWNMDAGNIAAWTEASFPGNTTYSLKAFTDALTQVAYAVMGPSLSDTYIYFKY